MHVHFFAAEEAAAAAGLLSPEKSNPPELAGFVPSLFFSSAAGVKPEKSKPADLGFSDSAEVVGFSFFSSSSFLSASLPEEVLEPIPKLNPDDGLGAAALPPNMLVPSLLLPEGEPPKAKPEVGAEASDPVELY